MGSGRLLTIMIFVGRGVRLVNKMCGREATWGTNLPVATVLARQHNKVDSQQNDDDADQPHNDIRVAIDTREVH